MDYLSLLFFVFWVHCIDGPCRLPLVTGVLLNGWLWASLPSLGGCSSFALTTTPPNVLEERAVGMILLQFRLKEFIKSGDNFAYGSLQVGLTDCLWPDQPDDVHLHLWHEFCFHFRVQLLVFQAKLGVADAVNQLATKALTDFKSPRHCVWLSATIFLVKQLIICCNLIETLNVNKLNWPAHSGTGSGTILCGEFSLLELSEIH